MSHKDFYITTTLPYVNAEPHVGHALEFIRADVIARAKRLQGYNVFFNTGTDEHGLKDLSKGFAQGEDYVQAYRRSDIPEQFKKLQNRFSVLNDDVHFIRTTDPGHIKCAQEFWKI
jgi:methionyl-tRNA synthetase